MAKVIKGHFQKSTPQTSQTDERPAPDYVFHVSILFSDPLIWRRILVPGNYTLAQLHTVIQAAMGWQDSEPHQFLVGKISYVPAMKSDRPLREVKRFDENQHRLHTIEEGMQFMFTYFYDAGEGWEHSITLEERLPGSREVHPAEILDGEMACPPEEVGDVHEYVQLVSAHQDPKNSNRRQLVELCGDRNFDPTHFDLEQAKLRLARTGL